jgi:DNA-binding transcriptional LysR family regulator
MEDLNDIYFFASVVQYGGFSAAARAIGVEKKRLSRRISALEKRLGRPITPAHYAGSGSDRSWTALL